MKRGKKANLIEYALNFFADFGIYSFAVLGVLVSKYLPQFRVSGTFHLEHIELGTLLMSCIIAFMISFGMDFDADTDGARKRWKRRAAFALANGAMWHTIIGG